MKSLFIYFTISVFFLTYSTAFSQTFGPGYIVRQAGTTDIRAVGSPAGAFPSATSAISGRDILNPDYGSSTNALNFATLSPYSGVWTATNDVSNSEINYKPLPPYSSEPYGDLRRGPNHLFSDFVPSNTADGASYYMYYRNSVNTEALCFRMRLGSIIPGAKGYSILIDTDGKFGSTGSNADPNYLPATNGNNGNPGFELEVDLFTQTSGQTGIALYNVDGLNNGSLVWSANDYTQFSQVVLAGTNDGGTPDFYLDFFVPFGKITGISSLGVTASTPLRIVPTTVMAPQPAIGGPKSDIYGLNDAAYANTNSQYITFIQSQGQFTATDLAAANTTIPTAAATICTAAPFITSATTTTVSGTWTKLNNSTQSSATIYLYKNGAATSFASTTATSGSTWSATGLTNLAGDLIVAKALATSESMCQSSNTYIVTTCTNAMWVTAAIPAPTGTGTNATCLASGTTTKGVDGSNRTSSTWTVYVNEAYSNTTQNSVSNQGSATFANGGGTIFTPATTPNWTYSGGCAGGANMGAGTYAFWYKDPNGCQSDITPVCVTGTGNASAQMGGTVLTPTISPTGINASTKSVTITGAAGSTISLYVDGQVVSTGTIAGTFDNTTTGTITFSNLNFQTGDLVSAVSNRIVSGTIHSSYCMAKSSMQTVACYASAPTINTNNSGQLTIGSYITGTSGEASGTTIKLYNSGNTLLATTTVSSSGIWTTNGATFSNGFLGTAVAGTTYYAQTVLGSCLANSASIATAASVTNASRCGAITNPATILSTTTSLSGTLSSSATSTTVTIYQDGIALGSQSAIVNTTSWGAISVTGLYSKGVVSLGIQEINTEEVICPTTYTVSCTAPLTPTMTYSGCTNCTVSGNMVTLNRGGTITYTIGNLAGDAFYSLADATTGQALSSGGIWTATSPGANLSLTASADAAGTGTFAPKVFCTTVSSSEVCTSSASPSSSTGMRVLPIDLIEFKGSWMGKSILLTWKSADEIDFSHFEIERSADGFSYSKIGYQNSLGSNSSYTKTDLNPNTGNNYYRLKMVDIDGRFKYSKIILLKENGASVVLNTIKPNPFENEMNLSVLFPKEGQARILLVDASGRTVLVKTTNVNRGLNEIKLSGLYSLGSGLYLIKIYAEDAVIQQKVMKMNR